MIQRIRERLKRYDKGLDVQHAQDFVKDPKTGIEVLKKGFTITYLHPNGNREHVLDVLEEDANPGMIEFQITMMDRQKGAKKDWSYEKDIKEKNQKVRDDIDKEYNEAVNETSKFVARKQKRKIYTPK